VHPDPLRGGANRHSNFSSPRDIPHSGGSKGVVLFEDRPLQAVIALWGLLIVFLLYLM